MCKKGCFHPHCSQSKRKVEAHPFRFKLSSVNKRLKSPHSPHRSCEKTDDSTSISQNLNPVIVGLVPFVGLWFRLLFLGSWLKLSVRSRRFLCFLSIERQTIYWSTRSAFDDFQLFDVNFLVIRKPISIEFTLLTSLREKFWPFGCWTCDNSWIHSFGIAKWPRVNGCYVM